MLSVIYFYSNVPFMERTEQYYFLRFGRTRFCCRNLLYIVISGFALSFSLWGISILDMITCVSFNNKWDIISRTLALTNAGNEIGILFSVPYKPIERFLPIQLCGYSLIATAFCIALIGMIMYVLCLLFHKSVAVIITGVVVMLPDIMKEFRLFPTYLSPVSWMGCDTWRYGYDVSKPDLAYIFVCYIFLIFIFGAICLFLNKKIEFTL